MKEALKIAVLGTAGASLDDAPFGDKSWKIWSIAYNASLIPRGDKWFELHDEEVLSHAGLTPGGIELLRSVKTDLVVQKKGEYFPEATEYPLHMVLEQFPRRYFTSSISWMLALAIIAKPEEIGLWGVNMCDTEEYAYQKGACEYLVGVAEGKGIKVTVSKGSPICRSARMYAFEDVGISRELAAKRRAMKNDIAEREADYNKARDGYNFWRGREYELNDISNRWR